MRQSVGCPEDAVCRKLEELPGVFECYRLQQLECIHYTRLAEPHAAEAAKYQ